MEFSILASAEARKRLLEAASRRATLNRSKIGGKLLNKDPSTSVFDPGAVTTNVNPNFMKVASDEKTNDADSVSAAIIATKEVPMPEMWSKFQESMSSLLTVLQESHAQLLAIKAAEAAAVIGGGATIVSSPSSSAPPLRTKREFGAKSQSSPRGGSGGAAFSDDDASGSNPLLSGATRSAAMSVDRGGSQADRQLASLSVFSGSGSRRPALSAGGRGLSSARSAISPLSGGSGGDEDHISVNSPLHSATPVVESVDSTPVVRPQTVNVDFADDQDSSFANPLSVHSKKSKSVQESDAEVESFPAPAYAKKKAPDGSDDDDASSFSNPLRD
jgi:hypothetical protein